MNWKRASVIFFAIYFLGGLLIYSDYGLGWDDAPQRLIGFLNWDYVDHHSKALLSADDRYHGPVMEMLLVAVERGLHIRNYGTMLKSRHLVTFLVFYFSMVAFFFTAKKLFGSNAWALVSTAALVLSPKIFGESFFNSKDTIFLSAMVFWLLTLLRLREKPDKTSLVLHALATALAIDMRILGVIAVPVSVAVLVNESYLAPLQRRKYLLILGSYLFLAFCFMVMFWPALWESPFVNLWKATRLLSRFPHGSVKYLGHQFPPGPLPWHYLPVCILISTPFLFTLLWVAGSIIILKRWAAAPFVYLKKNLVWLCILMMSVAPVVMVIATHAIVYNSWRHVFFIYPFFILVAVYALKYAVDYAKGAARQIVIAAFAVYLGWLLGVIVYMHPVESTYFNLPALVCFNPMDDKFEKDYWGLSYKQALEYFLNSDIPRPIKIYAANGVGRGNKLLFSADEQKEFVFKDSVQDADYYITNYPWECTLPKGKVVYEINKFGVPVITALRITK